jgi:uncharacterized membrane protein YedE/YeeE
MSSTTAPVTSLPASRVSSAVPPWAKLGILFGLLSAASIALYGPIGVSGTYPRLIGAAARAVDPTFAAANPYLVKMGAFLQPESMLVIGLLIGGFLASRIGKRRTIPAFEVLHASETTAARRYTDAFAGGVLILFGARLAGGCTSGHIISGITQLSLSGMVFAAGVFVAGIGTAKLLKRGY